MIIKSKRFVLRPYRKGDEKSLQKNINNKFIYKHTCSIPYPYTKKEADKWIKHNIKLNKIKSKKEINFAIDIYGKVIGGIGFRNIQNHKAEIGYWLGRDYWNEGVMTEVVKLITNFGFNKLKLRRIYANVFNFNKASAKVLEKNGYTKEGLMRKFTLKDKKYIDVLLYAKVK